MQSAAGRGCWVGITKHSSGPWPSQITADVGAAQPHIAMSAAPMMTQRNNLPTPAV